MKAYEQMIEAMKPAYNINQSEHEEGMDRNPCTELLQAGDYVDLPLWERDHGVMAAQSTTKQRLDALKARVQAQGGGGTAGNTGSTSVHSAAYPPAHITRYTTNAISSGDPLCLVYTVDPGEYATRFVWSDYCKGRSWTQIVDDLIMDGILAQPCALILCYYDLYVTPPPALRPSEIGRIEMVGSQPTYFAGVGSGSAGTPTAQAVTRVTHWPPKA